MKKHLFQTLLATATVSALHAAPVELGRESFETTPGIGYTTSVAEFDDPGTANSDFFGKFPNDGTRTRGVIAGGAGSNVFMAEDIDQVAPVGPTQFLTTNAFNIAGKINTSVKVLLAAPGTGPSGTVVNGGHQNHYDHDVTIANVDFVRVEASVDGGPFNRLIMFSPNTATTNQPLSLDADGDYLGGGAPTLNATFQEFDLPIPTGTTVQVRVVMHTNATNEYIVVDNIRIFGEGSATAAPVLAGVPATALTFTEGGAATPVAPAITVTDTDSANLTGATVSVSQNYVNGEDVLAATASGGVSVAFTPASGVLTLSGTATKAAYQTVLRSVTYRNTNTTAPSVLTRQIRFSATDGTGTSNQPIREVQVTDAIALQTLPFVESFETNGLGTRYALDGRFTSSAVAYFDRQTTVPGVTNLDGTAAVVAEDTDVSAAPVKAVRFLLNTAGYTGSQAVMRLAAPGGAIYDTGDLIAVEASADGGAWTSVGTFRSTVAFAGSMALDTNNDGLGDGTPLTAALQNFTFNLPAATSLGLRVRFVSNVGGERLVVDRIAVTGVLPPVVVTNAGDGGPGSLRAALAAAASQPGPGLIQFDPVVFNGEAADVITLTSTEIAVSDPGSVLIDASGNAGGVTISGNNARRIFNVATGSVLTLQGLTLTGGNSNNSGGGAIFSTGNLTLKGCTLTGNTSGPIAGGGGAIFSTGAASSLQLENCTFTGNTADFGGAIWSNGTAFNFTHCTIAGNTGRGGTAGIVVEGNAGTIANCIIAGNLTTNNDRDIGGAGSALTRSGVNLIGVPAGSYSAPTAPGLPNANGDFIGTLANPLAPRLAPLANNGGSTRTMAPLPGSPARDRIATITLSTDQCGLARPQWGAADIGAVEAGIHADCAWEVRDVFTSPVTALGNLPNTDAMLANPAATNITGAFPFANFNDLNGAPSTSYFGGDFAFLCNNLTPQGLINTDDDSFATQARAYLTITTAGTYTFGFSTDDGARLRLYSTNGGANPVFTSSTSLTGGNPNVPAHSGNAITFGAPTGDSATLGVCTLSPGVYGVEFTMWEDFGGASAEVFFASGAQTAIASCALLGGTQLTRTPGVSRPLNDDFAAALPLSGAVVNTASCNAGATMEAGESSGALPQTKSVWWTWTAPATAGYQIDTIGSSFDTILAVLTGSSLNGLTQLAIDDDSGGGTNNSKLNFGAVAGMVYRINVSGYSGGEGNIRLNIGPAANAAPSFTAGANQNAFTNAGPQTVSGWATAMNPGAPWEAAQQLSFFVTSNAPGLFLVAPAIAPDGTLTYTPAPTAGGTAVVSVQIHDNGGTANGGVDTSVPQTFTITTALAPTTGTSLTINAGGSGSGTAAVSQNFNAITIATTPWVDNSTVPGWYAQMNNGATASGNFEASNGAAALNGLINCGATAAADRALGSKATGTGNFANISYAVVMRNVGPLPVKLTRLRYAEELWRSGSVASAPEKVTVFYAISDSPLASIASGGTSATAVAGAGFIALPAGANTQVSSTTVNTALDGNLAANRSAVNFVPAAADLPVIFPGQYITVKWTDTNEAAGTDGHQAIDDVILDFTEAPCALLAAVSNVVRRPGALPDGSADTVDFTLNVAGVGNGLSAAGWQVTGPAGFATNSAYGTTVFYSAYAASSFVPPPVLTIRDAADANCTTTVTVVPPAVLGRVDLGGSPAYIQASPASPLFRQTALQELTMDPGTAVLTTDAVALTPGAEKCLTFTVLVDDTSTGSGFEAADRLKVEVLATTPDGTEVETLTYDFDLNQDGFVTGGATPAADELNSGQQAFAVKWSSAFRLVGTVPASATSLRLRITATIDGNVAGTSSEVFRFLDAMLTVCTDTDGDGVTDAWEWAHGTNPADAASRYSLTGLTQDATNTTLTVPGTTGSTYQLLSSTDLQTWIREGLPATGANAPLNLIGPATSSRTFRRVLVAPVQTLIP